MNEKKKIRVLIADDEEHLREIVKSVCESMNCDVVGEATNGREAVELYRSLKPQLTLLDINMPGMDGKAALEAIKDEFPEAIIIMLSSLTDMDLVKECLEAGAANYISKNSSLKEIRRDLKETWDEFKSHSDKR